MYACRNLVDDLAKHLWRAPGEDYLYLRATSGGPLKVGAASSINRIRAYMHQKRLSDRAGRFVEAELERIMGSIHALYELANKGHGDADRSDLETATLGAYFLLGELISRTDMSPVTDVTDPGSLGSTTN